MVTLEWSAAGAALSRGPASVTGPPRLPSAEALLAGPQLFPAMAPRGERLSRSRHTRTALVSSARA